MSTQNLHIQSNLFKKDVKEPQDLRGKPLKIEKTIDGTRRLGAWNHTLSGINQYTSNKLTITKEFILEQQQAPQSDQKQFSFVNNYFADTHADTDDEKTLDNFIHALIDKYYEGVTSAYVSHEHTTETRTKRQQPKKKAVPKRLLERCECFCEFGLARVF